METKWENGRFFIWSSSSSKWNDVTNTLTLPQLEQAVINNNITVFQALAIAYIIGGKNI